MIGEFDIVGGDKAKVGYFVGILVRETLHFLSNKGPYQ